MPNIRCALFVAASTEPVCVLAQRKEIGYENTTKTTYLRGGRHTEMIMVCMAGMYVPALEGAGVVVSLP